MTDQQSTGAAKRQIKTLQKRVKELEEEVDDLETKLAYSDDKEQLDEAADHWKQFVVLMIGWLGDRRGLPVHLRLEMEEIDLRLGQ